MADDLEWSAAFRLVASKAIMVMAVQKLAAAAVYQLHQRPSETLERFLRFISKSVGGMSLLMNLGGRVTTYKEQVLLLLARQFIDHMADTIYLYLYRI